MRGAFLGRLSFSHLLKKVDENFRLQPSRLTAARSACFGGSGTVGIGRITGTGVQKMLSDVHRTPAATSRRKKAIQQHPTCPTRDAPKHLFARMRTLMRGVFLDELSFSPLLGRAVRSTQKGQVCSTCPFCVVKSFGAPFSKGAKNVPRGTIFVFTLRRPQSARRRLRCPQPPRRQFPLGSALRLPPARALPAPRCRRARCGLR